MGLGVYVVDRGRQQMLHIPSGAVYKNTRTDTLVEVTHVEDTWGASDPECCTVEYETVEDGEWASQYHDNFEHVFSKVADSVNELEA